MPAQPTHLFLFDIDGTLIASGGAGEYSMRLAVLDMFGVENGLEGVEIAGRTDHLITENVFKKFGVQWTPERATEFLDLYLRHLAEELPRKKGRLLPGIVELLDALKARPDVAMALLTGNLERGAEIKLTHYGVWNYFEFGAYADDHADRNRLGPFAQARAQEHHGVEFPPERIFVLGDTPHDITCGRVIGAKTVAIATGGFTREQLAAHQPDFLFDDLGDVAGVLATLGV
ncbi:MAG: HAD family hydrolase [Verrucomicrobia bacterium]|nr:HAD family hydrolase [Verrucomicrobiota bacterium]